MEATGVRFHEQGVPPPFEETDRIARWISAVVRHERGTLEGIDFIFCRDTDLQELNHRFLGKDDLTDTLTFPEQEYPDPIMGEVHISVPRVRENAIAYQCSFHEELFRVMAHSVLHLLGYKDDDPEKKERMHEKEDEVLSLESRGQRS